GYLGTGASSPARQKRTLTLSNGEVIWDFSGNLAERIADTPSQAMVDIFKSDPNQNGLEISQFEWNQVNFPSLVPPNVNPSYGTPMASQWTSVQGIGKASYNQQNTASLEESLMIMGGGLNALGSVGVLALYVISNEFDSYFPGFR